MECVRKPVISIRTQVVELHKNFDHCKYSLCVNKKNILGGYSSFFKPKAWNYLQFNWINLYRVVKSSQLLVKIPAYLVSSIGCLLCLAFVYGWCFLNEISLDWPLTLTTQPTASSTIFIFATLLVSKRLVSKWFCIRMTSNHVSWYPSALACLSCFAVSVTL